MDKCTIDLIQSYITEVDSNSELAQIVSEQSFKDKLEAELFERNLDPERTSSEKPITSPAVFKKQDSDEKKIDYRVYPVSDEDHPNSQIGKAISVNKIMNNAFNVNISSASQETSVQKITQRIEKHIDKLFNELRTDYNELKSGFDMLCDYYRNPQILTQLVFELRISAINKEYPDAKLPMPGFPDSNKKYTKTNGDFDHQKFDEDFNKLKKKIREEKMSETTHYLNLLFNFNLKYFNEKIDRPLSSYNKYEIVEAVESMLGGLRIDDPTAANLPVVQLYHEWENKQTNLKEN